MKLGLIIMGLNFFNMGWFYITEAIPSQVEALILINFLVIGIVDIILSLFEKEQTSEGASK